MARTGDPLPAPPEATDDEKRRALEQARARALQALQLACDRRHRAELERTIEEIDQRLTAMP